jgi:tRNA pseudouridine38-40 synthase
VPEDLDLDAMRQALDLFRGFHDFASFADKRMEKGASTQVSVEGLWVREFGEVVAIRVLGSHFLWKMVRRVVGVAVEAGRRTLAPAEIESMLVSYSEVPKKHTAPAHGLFLEKVLYEGDSLPEMKLPVAVW